MSQAVYSSEGDLLGARIASDGQWRFAPPDSLPSKYISSLIAYEDQRFYYHFGIDPMGLGAAIYSQCFSRSKRGGSTIPMQIMRMALNNKHRSLLAKLEESIYAIYLTVRYKKSTQLKIYAAHAPYGSNIVGLDAACWRLLGKSPHMITWGEAAMLAVLPNTPSLIHAGKNRPKLKIKRDKLLHTLFQKKIIDSITYELSIIEPIPQKPHPLPNLYPHVVQSIKHYNKDKDRHHTTIEKDMQHIAYEAATYYGQSYAQNMIHNIAILILENSTGNVLAYIGNNSENKNSNAIDMTLQPRSSGSILKPLLYSFLLQEGKTTPRQLQHDSPVYFNGYQPQNFDKSYRGMVAADEALQRSLNIPFINMLKSYGIGKFHHQLQKCKITTLNKPSDHYGLSLIVGGGEVSLWEICGLYSSMARILQTYTRENSRYTPMDWHMPILVKKQSKAQTKKLLPHPTHFAAGAIYTCFNALTELKRPDEEGMWQEFSSNKKLAWKTGTSFGHRDAWAIGVDREYTVGVWVGNADGSRRANLTGVQMAAPILFDIYNRLPNTQWFDMPYDDMYKATICTQSGEHAGENCPQVDTTYLPLACNEMLPCQYHKILHVDLHHKYQVNTSCKSMNEIVTKSYLILPAETITYYRQHHPQYEVEPPMHPDCQMQMQATTDNFSIIYPNQGITLTFGEDVSGTPQAIILKATHTSDLGRLYWHVDDQYLGTTQKFHTMTIRPAPGKHKLVVMNESGAQQSRYFKIE